MPEVGEAAVIAEHFIRVDVYVPGAAAGAAGQAELLDLLPLVGRGEAREVGLVEVEPFRLVDDVVVAAEDEDLVDARVLEAQLRPRDERSIECEESAALQPGDELREGAHDDFHSPPA
ncbi:MAG: hypothetical protein QXI90_05330 [Thermofilum sp.]